MRKKLKLRTFQVGAPAKRGEGFRISTARRPPRGVAKADWLRGGHFDAWLPILGPSEKLRSSYKKRDHNDADVRRRFFATYEREMLGKAESRQTIAFLAGLAMRMPISIGCFCADEKYCHRSRLRLLIERAAEDIAD